MKWSNRSRKNNPTPTMRGVAAPAAVGAPRVVRRLLQQHVPRLEAPADVVDLGKVERPAQV